MNRHITLLLAFLFIAVGSCYADSGRRGPFKTWIVDSGKTNADGYGLFDFHARYAVPRKHVVKIGAYNIRALAALVTSSKTGGIRTWTDAKFFYVEVTAGFRARWAPAQAGEYPYAFKSDLNTWATSIYLRFYHPRVLRDSRGSYSEPIDDLALDE